MAAGREGLLLPEVVSESVTGVGERPYVELEPTDHPLAIEQRAGITQDRGREITVAVFHSGSSEEQ